MKTSLNKEFLKCYVKRYLNSSKLVKNICIYLTFNKLTLEGMRGEGGGGHFDTPSGFLALMFFCSLTDYQKLSHNCSLFVKTSVDPL